ncbi:MAG: S49 family peptidase [Gammaproteobacteria bacterium]|nr:S49 family peptidase [Gammaproteobacteria bacterium]
MNGPVNESQEASAVKLLQRILDQQIQETKVARRWKYFYRFSWLIFSIVLVAMTFFGGFGNPSVTSYSSSHLAMIEISGVIAEDTKANARNTLVALKNAMENPASVAVVLAINSPGGSPVQAGIIYDEIMRLKKIHNKPIYSVAGESCTSAAYYIASATDKIWVNKASLIGSIGVLIDSFGFNELMQKMGIQRRLLTSGENKSILDPFSPLTAKHKVLLENMITTIHQQFIQSVKRGRGDKIKGHPDLFSGLFWIGEEAIKLGIADELGTIDTIAREVTHTKDIINYTLEENVVDRLSRKFASVVGQNLAETLLQHTKYNILSAH